MSILKQNLLVREWHQNREIVQYHIVPASSPSADYVFGQQRTVMLSFLVWSARDTSVRCRSILYLHTTSEIVIITFAQSFYTTRSRTYLNSFDYYITLLRTEGNFPAWAYRYHNQPNSLGYHYRKNSTNPEYEIWKQLNIM